MTKPAASLTLFLLLLGTAAAAPATVTAPAPTALPEVGSSLLRLAGALAFVLAVFFGGVWLFKNWQRLTLNKGRTPKLNVMEVRPLGNRHALYVVAYEDQRLLLSSSPAGVSFLSHLPAGTPEEKTEASPAAIVPIPFAATLHQLLAHR